MRIRREVQAVIFSEENDGKKFLIIKILDLAKNRFLWRLVKGGIEEKETEERALKREISEEVGLKRVQILKKIYDYNFVFKNIRHSVSVYSVRADVNEKVKLSMDGERPISEYKWVNGEQAIKMLYWKQEKQAIKLLI